MSKLLSIIIPTVGNPELLKISLDSLCPQVERYIDKVEFIVSFNSPPKESVDMIEEYEKTHHYIQHTVFDERVEIVQSFVRSIALSSGKYIILFGDDDVAYPYLLDEVIGVLTKTDNLSIVHFNILKGKDFGDTFLKGLATEYSVFKPYNEIMPLDEFLLDHAISPGFISSMVFSRESWDRGMDEDYNENKGYGFLMLIYKGAVGTNCVYISRPLVMQRQPYNRVWLDKWPYYCLIDIPHLMHWIENKGISNKEVVNRWYNRDNKSLLKYCYTLFMASAYKDKYKPLCKKINSYQSSLLRKVLTYLIIYLVPSGLYFLYRKRLYRE